MTRLPELHRQLVLAARREEQRAAARHAAVGDAGRGVPARLLGALGVNARRTRLALASFVVLLSMTTIALAASGVIFTGSAVPGAHLHPGSGVGVPADARLLALRVADPDGGLPWGMRVVRTSRQMICLQVGRVEHGQLGELGVDGAFDDDGEFHPLPADALPSASNGFERSDLTMSCTLSGASMMSGKVAIPSSALAQVAIGFGARRRLNALARGDLRDVYFGALGPRAVSVSYREGGKQRTQRVVPGTGAYLIVQPSAEGQPRESGGGESGTGLLAPGPGEPLTKVTYRVKGELCEAGLAYTRGREGAWTSHGPAHDVAHPCAEREERHPRGSGRLIRLHLPLHVHVQIANDVVTGLSVSFKAPYAVGSAREDYSVFLPQTRCHGRPEPEVLGGTGFPLDRDVHRGAVVSTFIAYPFRVSHSCGGRTVTIDILYRGEKAALTIVASRTVKQPRGTRNGAPGRG